MKQVRLNNGVMMPAIGFGVFQIPVKDTERIVSEALETGYRMIDTAASYFNEEQVGNAIRQSELKREDIFVTTKLWVQDYEYDDALRAFDLSMKKLGLDYLDLYLLHKPYGNYYAAWRAAERLYKEGRIRAIGVTSFSNERLQDLFLHNEVKPAVNQLETHPFFQQQAANTFLRQEGIQDSSALTSQNFFSGQAVQGKGNRNHRIDDGSGNAANHSNRISHHRRNLIAQEGKHIFQHGCPIQLFQVKQFLNPNAKIRVFFHNRH